MKICLGTANFKKFYGINKFRHGNKNIAKLLSFAQTKKINFLDTASEYKNSEILSKTKKFKIITKLTKLRDLKETLIRENINKQLKNYDFRKKKLYGVLLHDCNDMRSKKSKFIFECLMDLKKRKITDKIGISCYYEKDLDILKAYNFDIIQFPLNIFDQRILKKKNLSKIKKKEVHVRSIFLQGILLNKDIENHKYFKKWKINFRKINSFIKKNNITKLEANLIFLKKFSFFKYAVIGFNDICQMNDVLKIINSKKKYKLNFDKLKSNNQNLIIPSNWKN